MMDKCETCVWYVYDERTTTIISVTWIWTRTSWPVSWPPIPEPVPIGAPATTISPRESNKKHPRTTGGACLFRRKETPPIGWCFLFSAVPRQASRLRRRSSAAVPV